MTKQQFVKTDSIFNSHEASNFSIRELHSRKDINDILVSLHPIIKSALNEVVSNILKESNSKDLENTTHKLLQLAVMDAITLENYLEKLIKKHTPIIGTKKKFIKAETDKIAPVIGELILKYINKYTYENFSKIEKIHLITEDEKSFKRVLQKLFK